MKLATNKKPVRSTTVMLGLLLVVSYLGKHCLD